MTGKAVVLTLIVLLIGAAAWADGYDDLIGRADDKAAAGEYEEALELYLTALKSEDAYHGDYYNAACVAALSGNADAAFALLEEVVGSGLFDREMLEDDSDLESLRSDEQWEALLKALDENREAIIARLPETQPEEPAIDLPDPRTAGDISVEEVLNNRRSVRAYADIPLTVAEISQLLWAAYGITYPVDGGPAFLRGGLRTAPSAGARYPLELYLVARNVHGVPAGVYWYRSETHQLIAVVDEDRWKELSDAGFQQPHFGTAAAAIVFSAVFERNTEVYGKRGRERYVCMDLGHSAENLYLQAQALKIGTCAIGAFGDLALRKAVNMSRAEEPLYIMPLGKVE
jgi:SagB-type dehydrogenase family enzyme